MPFSAFNELRRRSFARDTKAPTFGFELEGDPFRVPARVPATCDKAPHFAGPLARRVSSIGILCFGSLLAAIGLYGLSVANAPLPAIAAATVWGIGVCYFYPTMVASVAERFPRGRALLMGLIGFAGGISIQFILARFGAIFDRAKLGAGRGMTNFAPASHRPCQPLLKGIIDKSPF